MDNKFIEEKVGEFLDRFVEDHKAIENECGWGDNTPSPQEIIDFLRQSLSSQKAEIIKEIEDMSYMGVLDSNEKRRGYDTARTEIIKAIENL